MGQIENIKNSIRNIPEFSEKNYRLVGYVFAALITVAGLFLIYKVITTDFLVFKANWNMFNSVLMWPLYIIGLLVMFANWNLFSFSYDTYDRITYSDGRTEVKRNWDLIEWLMGHVLIPLICRFFLVPIIIAAIIYYPLMCIVHLIGAIFSYIVALLVVVIIFVSWKFTSWFQFRYHSLLLIIVGLVVTISFSWGGYELGDGYIGDPGPDTVTTEVNGNGTGDDGGEEPGDGGDNNDDNGGDTNDDGDGNGDDPEEPGDDGDGNDDDGGNGDEPKGSDSKAEETGQFGGGPCVGLYSSLLNGETAYEGDMEGLPIELIIKKDGPTGSLKGIFKNVRQGSIMQLSGKSLPSMDCDINFYGEASDEKWSFYLTGDADEITGTAKCDDAEFDITLKKKKRS